MQCDNDSSEKITSLQKFPDNLMFVFNLMVQIQYCLQSSRNDQKPVEFLQCVMQNDTKMIK